jgi:hypothetical protein
VGIGTVDALLNGRLPQLNWYKAAFTGQGAGFMHSPLYVAGLPGAGSAPSAGVNGAVVANGRTGTLAAPTAVANKSCYLNAAGLTQAANIAAAFLVDRLWENSGLSVTSTSSQAITPVALPARDQNGSTNGAGIEFGIEVTASLGAATATATLTYTDSDGNTGATATVTVPTSCVAGTFLPFPLAAGDYGVRVPTAFQLSLSLVSGSLSLVGFRRIGRMIQSVSANIPDGFGPADGGGPVADGIAPHFIYILSGTAAGITAGMTQFVQA